MKADDPVSKYLPKTVKVPTRNGKEITLLDLSMQISGLPRLPGNMKMADPTNPYAGYTPALLYDFLSGYTLTRDIGEKYEYSNLGVGLLGHTLALRAAISYEDLIRKRITAPLGMNSTAIVLSEGQKERFATGHDASLAPVRAWDFDALAGAGAIRSNMNDILKFAAANLELVDTPLKKAMRRMLTVTKATGVPDLDIAMGWHIWKRYGTTIIWHNGGTAGFRTFLGLAPATKSAVVVLSNSSLDPDDLGLHTLESRWSMKVYPERKEIPVDPKTLETYVGEYELTPAFKIAVTPDGGRLFVQATGQPKFEVFAENKATYFLKAVDAQITFTRSDAGVVESLTLHQNGRQSKGRKLNRE